MSIDLYEKRASRFDTPPFSFNYNLTTARYLLYPGFCSSFGLALILL